MESREVYMTPDMEMIEFEMEDVIVTSDPFGNEEGEF